MDDEDQRDIGDQPETAASSDPASLWRITPERLVLVNGADNAAGIGRAPRHPEYWPISQEELQTWVAESRPELVVALISEEPKGLRAAEIQDRLLALKIVDSHEAASIFWRRVSKKLAKQSRLSASGKGAGRRYALAPATLDSKTGVAEAHLDQWISGGGPPPPSISPAAIVESTNKCVRDLVRHLYSNPGSDELDPWTPRVARLSLLQGFLHKSQKADHSLFLEALARLGRRSHSAPTSELQAQLIRYLLQSAPDSTIELRPPAVVAALAHRDLIADAHMRLLSIGGNWAPTDWPLLPRAVGDANQDISPSDIHLLARTAADQGAHEVALRLLQVIVERCRSETGAWTALGLLAEWQAAPRLEELSSFLIGKTLGGGRPPSRALGQLISKTRAEALLAAEEALAAKEGEVAEQQEDLKAKLGALATLRSELEQRQIALDEYKQKADADVAEMASRLERARIRGRLEERTSAWRVLAQTIEVLLDRIDIDPEGISRAAQRIEAELARVGVSPVSERGETVVFDPRLHEWLSSGEPSSRVTILQRPYVARERDVSEVLIKGLVKSGGTE